MGESDIIELRIGSCFLIGVGYHHEQRELAFCMGFVLLTIQFKKKTQRNKWFSFTNQW